MIKRFAVALLLAWQLAAQIPFTIDATENVSGAFPGAPQLESASFAQWKGKWLFIGGRAAGYHSVGGASADFPRTDSNREVWVVDTNVKPAKTYHLPVTALPIRLACLKDEWIATSQLYYQDGSSLYVAGGYGQDSSGHWVTFPSISKIDLPRFIEGVMKGHFAGESVTFTSSALVQSAGGELIRMPGGNFYFVMGHVFTGSYTAFEGQGEHNSAPVSQVYLNEIRELKILTSAGGALSVTLVNKFRDDQEFHRRDLNVAPVLSSTKVGIGIYGGVFTPDTQLGYDKPIYVMKGERPVVDSRFHQRMSTYNCAKLLLYDRREDAMYTTFFGGISRYIWDAQGQRYLENPRTGKNEGNYLDGLQWSDQVSTLKLVSNGSSEETTEFVEPASLPAFLGTDALFIPGDELPRASQGTDILDLAKLGPGKVFAGYLYGGIRAYPFRFPYNKTAQPYSAGTVPTKPSDLILKVYVQLKPAGS
jgi:hypothetical protein